MSDQSVQPPSFKRFKISRVVSKFKSKHYDDSLIFHPSDETSIPSLLIEVINNKELVGVIPCANKDFICLNIPVIGARFKKDNKYRSREKDGVPIYELKGDLKTTTFEPQTVCDFIKGMTTGDLDVSFSNAVKFCRLADFWNCEQIFQSVESFVNDNMANEMFVDAWDFGVNFSESCSDYVKKYPGFIDEIIIRDIGRMEIGSLGAFAVECYGCGVDNAEMIMLMVEWFKVNPTETQCKNLILSNDFSDITDDNKMRIYIDISMNFAASESDFLKEFADKIFKDMNLSVADLIGQKPLQSKKLECQIFCKIGNDDDVFNTIQEEVSTNVLEIKDDGKTWTAVSPEASLTLKEQSWKIKLENNSSDHFTYIGIINTDVKGYHSVQESDHDEEMTELACYKMQISSGSVKAQHWLWNDEQDARSSFRRVPRFEFKTAKNYGGNDMGKIETVEVKFYQEKRQLEFVVNGVTQGIAYSDIKVCNYRLFVEVCSGPNKLSII